jgi:hypothetical protein
MPDSSSHIDLALPRHDWSLDEVEALFDLPFAELVFQAAPVHRRWFRSGRFGPRPMKGHERLAERPALSALPRSVRIQNPV